MSNRKSLQVNPKAMALHSGQAKTGSWFVSSVTQDSFGEANGASKWFPKTGNTVLAYFPTKQASVDTQVVETFQGHGILKTIDAVECSAANQKKNRRKTMRHGLWRRRCKKHMWVLALCPLSSDDYSNLRIATHKSWCHFNTAHALINGWSFHDLVSHVESCAVESMHLLTCSGCNHKFCNK